MALGRPAAGVGVGAVLVSVFAGSCSRDADLPDLPEHFAGPPPALDATEAGSLDVGLDGAAFPACSDRPEGECQPVRPPGFHS